ncbi:isocitrate lyase/phosphoenolpyruvate mutase family protein [Haloactinomyces albus]|uniref:Phosphoenolpyruvate phosphomutase n=1 Tax=Haloactinomyces albus TaxID=1352928 RepID=A0AAE3ZEP1_9ACTN|nr:phosphoenolpyruvate phosphomutase [Haloactinomyces albus]
MLGVYDGLGSRLAEESGADALWASSLGISAADAVPDANIRTMTDFLAALRSIRSGSDLPVVADCDSGFGDVNNVAHMVTEYERAGASAVCIEDKMFPKRNSFSDNQKLCDPEEFAAKVRVAKQTQRDPGFMVRARLESLIAGAGMRDALARGKLYESAGADVILIHSKSAGPDEVLEFMKRFRDTGSTTPLAIVPTTYPQLTFDDSVAAGASVVVYANHDLRARIAASISVRISRARRRKRRGRGSDRERGQGSRDYRDPGSSATRRAGGSAERDICGGNRYVRSMMAPARRLRAEPLRKRLVRREHLHCDKSR